jgi:hypothetical protein
MSNPERKTLEVENLSIAARTVVLDAAVAEGPASDGLFKLVVQALAEWRLALAAALAVAVATWVFLAPSRDRALLEFIVKPPVDELAPLRTAAEVTKAIELCSIARPETGLSMSVRAKLDKGAETITISAEVPRSLEASSAAPEAERIAKELDRALARSIRTTEEALDGAIRSIDGSIAETQEILKSRLSATGESGDTIAQLNAQTATLRSQREDFLRRKSAARGFTLIGDARLTIPTFASKGYLAPVGAGGFTFVAAAFLIRGIRDAKRSITPSG